MKRNMELVYTIPKQLEDAEPEHSINFKDYALQAYLSQNVEAHYLLGLQSGFIERAYAHNFDFMAGGLTWSGHDLPYSLRDQYE